MFISGVECFLTIANGEVQLIFTKFTHIKTHK